MRRPFLDKAAPSVWKAAGAFSVAVKEEATARGLTAAESELVSVRASQMNGCAFCLDLHTRAARDAGITQQQLDLLPAWRDSDLFTMRELAILMVTEAGTTLPLTAASQADLADARATLGDDVFAAVEWLTVAINAFNRVSILSEHPVRERDAAGALVTA